VSFEPIEGGVSKLEQALAETKHALSASEPERALDICRAALIESLGDDPARPLSAAQLVMVETLSDLAVLLGRVEAAEALVRTLADTLHAASNIEGGDYAVLKLAYSLASRGEAEAARDALNQLAEPLGGPIENFDLSPTGLREFEAKTSWRKLGAAPHALLCGLAYLSMATLLAEIGRYGAARVLADRALDWAREPGATAARHALGAKHMLGARIAFEAGELERARQAIGATSEEFDDVGLRVQKLELQAQIALTSGDLGAALRALTDLAAYCTHARLDAAARRAQLNVCRLGIALNQTYAVETELTKLTQSGDPETAREAAVLSALVQKRRATGADPTALGFSLAGHMRNTSATQARPASTEEAFPAAYRPGFYARFERMAQTVEIALAEADMVRAERQMADIERQCAATDSTAIRGRVQLLRGLIAFARGERSVAAAALADAAHEAQASGAKWRLWTAARTLSDCLSGDESAASTAKEWAQRADQLMAEMADTLPQSERTIYLINKSDAAEAALRDKVEVLLAMKRAAVAAPWPLRLSRKAKLSKAIAALCAELDASAGYTAARAPTASGVVTIGYLSFADMHAIIVHKRGRFDIGVCPISRLALRDEVAAWGQAVALSAGADAASASLVAEATGGQMRRLSEALQIGRAVKGAKLVRIVPDDVLHGFPFAAALCDDRPLIERVGVVLSASLLAGPAPKESRVRKACLVGVGRAIGKLQALPGAIAEARDIAELLRTYRISSDTLLDDDASRSALTRAAADANLLHIAAHGVFAADQPLQTGIILPDNGAPDIFNLRDIATLPMAHVAHVTLSACSVASSYSAPGRATLSAPRALLAAGAGGVLAPLWHVHDAFSILFMRRFLQHCRRTHCAEALRRTQRDCISNRLGATHAASPFLWAAFTYSGEALRLRFG
jgi:hypothetical protein